MNDKNVLNPLFPFLIRSLSSDVYQFHLSDCHQFIFLKTGTVILKNQSINDPSLLFFANDGGNAVKECFLLEGYQIVFTNRFYEKIQLTTSEKNILNELKFVDDKQQTLQGVCYPLQKEKAILINNIITGMHEEYLNKQRGYHTIIKSKFLEFLTLCYRSLEAFQPEKFKQGIDKVIDYIEKNYHKNLTLQELSQMAGLNPSYLSRLFKEKKGWPVFEYINQKRITKACLLLKNSDLSILDVSLAVGYNNLSFFYRCFKKIMNISPRDYKNRNKM